MYVKLQTMKFVQNPIGKCRNFVAWSGSWNEKRMLFSVAKTHFKRWQIRTRANIRIRTRIHTIKQKRLFGRKFKQNEKLSAFSADLVFYGYLQLNAVFWRHFPLFLRIHVHPSLVCDFSFLSHRCHHKRSTHTHWWPHIKPVTIQFAMSLHRVSRVLNAFESSLL